VGKGVRKVFAVCEDIPFKLGIREDRIIVRLMLREAGASRVVRWHIINCVFFAKML
jgi:hypothetical protein